MRLIPKSFPKKIDTESAALPLLFCIDSDNPRLLGVRRWYKWKNALLAQAFGKVGTALNQKNIPIMLMKGIARRALNPKMILPMEDADFAVPPDRFAEAIAIAGDCGFVVRHQMTHSADMLFGRHGAIDIHRYLAKGSSPRMDALIWFRARDMQAFGVRLKIPDKEDLLLLDLLNYYGKFIYELDRPCAKIYENHPMISEYIRGDFDYGKIIETAELSNAGYQIKALIFGGRIPRRDRKIMRIHP